MAIEEVTDRKLAELRAVPKVVRNPQAKWRAEERYERLDYEMASPDDANRFHVYLRQNREDGEDFSCGIRWQMPSGETLTLARYNGSSHVHGKIDRQCHIHEATEEAIQMGWKPEHRAAVTNRYNSLGGALHCLLKDFNVQGLESAPDNQMELLNGD